MTTTLASSFFDSCEVSIPLPRSCVKSTSESTRFFEHPSVTMFTLVFLVPFVFTNFYFGANLQKIPAGNSAPKGQGLYLHLQLKALKFIRFISLFILLTGCLGQPDCLITTTNLVKIAFKSGNNIRIIAFDEIAVSGLDKVYYQDVEVSAVQLPVNPQATEMTFTFTFEGREETLTIGYETSVQIISVDCGAFTNYGNLSVISSTFVDSQVLVNQLSTNATVNIQISVD